MRYTIIVTPRKPIRIVQAFETDDQIDSMSVSDLIGLFVD